MNLRLDIKILKLWPNFIDHYKDLAKELGHEALFITVTCPSKYHRAFSKSGAANPKWEGFMPDEANSYLNHQWQKARAEYCALWFSCSRATT